MPLTKEDLTKIIVAAKSAVTIVSSAKNKAVAISAVRTFQDIESKIRNKEPGSLKADGFYGPNSKAAAEYYLQGMKNVTIPNPASKFASSTITWKKPDLLPVKEVPTKPTTEEKKIETKPSQKSSTGAGVGPLAQIKSKVGKARKSALKKATDTKGLKHVKEVLEVLKTPKFGQELDFLGGKKDIEEAIAKNFNKPMDKILGLLQKGSLQTQATSEHKRLVNEDKFRKEVITNLATIIDRLPDSHPKKAALKHRLYGMVAL